jgi:hypothetical protein
MQSTALRGRSFFRANLVSNLSNNGLSGSSRVDKQHPRQSAKSQRLFNGRATDSANEETDLSQGNAGVVMTKNYFDFVVIKWAVNGLEVAQRAVVTFVSQLRLCTIMPRFFKEGHSTSSATA